jgi:hypothetical protein
MQAAMWQYNMQYNMLYSSTAQHTVAQHGTPPCTRAVRYLKSGTKQDLKM